MANAGDVIRASDGPPEFTDGTITAATDWSVTSTNSFVVSGRIAFLDFSAQYTGSGISVPSNGNIANTTVATIDQSDYHNRSFGGQVQVSTTGPAVTGFVDTNGNIQITAIDSGATISTNDNFRFTAIWLVALAA